MNDEKELIAFKKTFKTILSAIIPENPPKPLMSTMNWMKRCFEYNVPKGKHNRGLLVVDTVKQLAEKQNKTLTESELESARILGWTVELLQAYLLVVDDIMDQSITRRGQLCWYKVVSYLNFP